MRGPRYRKGYSAEELAFVDARRTMPRRELHAAFVKEFRRDDVSQQNLTALCKRRGWMTGRTGHFDKGAVPANKGKKMLYNAKSAATQFKKGGRSGVAAAVYKAIGSERIGAGGYLERKVHDGLPMQSRWRAVHLLRWEDAHGPIPDGHALKCLSGDRTDTDPANWELVPRGLLPRLNGRRRRYDVAPAEVKPSMMAVAKLEHAIAQRKTTNTTSRDEREAP